MEFERFLGIDFGDRRIGIAISDPTGTIARPHSLIEGKSKPEVVKIIADIVEEFEVITIVLGLPQNMDGSEGFRSDITHEFADMLTEAMDSVKVELIDERLTTVQAQRSLNIMNVSGKKKKKKIDSMAAALILQTFLDKRAFQKQQDLPDFDF